MNKKASVILLALFVGFVCLAGEGVPFAKDAIAMLRENRFEEAGALYEKAAAVERDEAVRWRYIMDALNNCGRSNLDNRIERAEKYLAGKTVNRESTRRASRPDCPWLLPSSRLCRSLRCQSGMVPGDGRGDQGGENAR